MLKRKILAAVLPVVAATTVVGAGFSAWYFGEWSANSSSTSVGVEITDKADSGTGEFKVFYNSETGAPGTEKGSSDTIKLVLDQGTGSDRITNLEKGISFVLNTTEDSIELKDLTFRYVIKESDWDALNKAGLQVDLKFQFTLNDSLSKYVQVKQTEEGEVDYSFCSGERFTTSDKKTFVVNKQGVSLIPGSGEKYYDIKFDLSTTAEINKFLEYTDLKPNNSDAYDTMESDLSGLGTNGIDFTFTASTSDKL